MTDQGKADFTYGLVLKRYSGFYYVQDAKEETIECKLRGKVKNQVILVGDRVRFTRTEEDKGIIEEVMPRSVELVRPAIANVNQVLVVMSFDQPPPNINFLDRLLILIENLNLEAVIVLNKCDLSSNQEVENIKKHYPRIGYPVLLTSSTMKVGLLDLFQTMSGKISVVAGLSGVGKTSLLNMLFSGWELKTGQVSTKLSRGKHTTRHVELFPLPAGGWVADTPGFTVVDTPAIKREDLSCLFKEFVEPARECRFVNCLHSGERDCGVKKAVKNGLILTSRYQNYLTSLTEVIEKERCYR